MKKTFRMIAALLSIAMLLLVSACGGTGTSGTSTAGTSTSEAAPVAVSEEEYQQAVDELQAKLTDIRTNNAKIEITDLEAAKTQLEEFKQPFVDFKDIVPPEAYAEAHTKLQSGCEHMITYADTIILLIQETDETKKQEYSNQIVEALGIAATDLTDGANMLAEIIG